MWCLVFDTILRAVQDVPCSIQVDRYLMCWAHVGVTKPVQSTSIKITIHQVTLKSSKQHIGLGGDPDPCISFQVGVSCKRMIHGISAISLGMKSGTRSPLHLFPPSRQIWNFTDLCKSDKLPLISLFWGYIEQPFRESTAIGTTLQCFRQTLMKLESGVDPVQRNEIRHFHDNA